MIYPALLHFMNSARFLSISHYNSRFVVVLQSNVVL